MFSTRRTANFTLDSIRSTYRFNKIRQNIVSQALEAFFESVGFEDAIRNAISIGSDSDTLAAITEGVPAPIWKMALAFLDKRLLKILMDFESLYPAKLEKTDVF